MKLINYLQSFLSPQESEVYKSKINCEIKVVEYFGKYAVYVDGAPQSGAEIRPMWERIISNLKTQNSKLQNCLILGVGGGDVINALNKYFPETPITAVELDPVMAEIANKYFGLNKIKLLKIIIDDALSIVSKNNFTEKYDLIVVDLFIGKYNPVGSRISVYLRQLKKKLTNAGIILFNSHFKPAEQKEFECFNNLCRKIFQHAEIIFFYRFNKVFLLGNNLPLNMVK